MKLIPGLICAGAFWTGMVMAQSPVTVTVEARASAATIPDDFAGLSFGMKALLPNKAGSHLFSATNQTLVALFRNIGLRHLRVGGTTVESPPATPIPGGPEIDNLFAFARAAKVNNIIYSLRLLETDPARPYAATNAAIAKYIWKHYRHRLDCFAIGNEPDRRNIFDQDLTITNFATYISQWRKFAAAITNAVPQAKFAGPDAGSGNISWTTRFAAAEKNSGVIKVITEHYYAGGKGKGLSASEGIESMLSRDRITDYQTLYDQMAAVVLSNGFPYRFTEANDHYSGGVRDASDTFAGALWALDFLHWWAAHEAKGVDFHNTQWVASDVIAPDGEGRLTIKPKGYGIKVFDLGSHGHVAPVAISNADGLNLTAYAVHEDGRIFVTIINKEHGAGARVADVTIVLDGIARRAEEILLIAPNGDVTAKTGVTLGGASLNDDEPWQGKWMPLAVDTAGRITVRVSAASAAIVKITTK
jgi:hypothetical protein